jgi:hypothetical protein
MAGDKMGYYLHKLRVEEERFRDARSANWDAPAVILNRWNQNVARYFKAPA